MPYQFGFYRPFLPLGGEFSRSACHTPLEMAGCALQRKS